MGIQLNGTSGTDVISAVDGSLTIDGDISVVDKIIHGGDTNTAIRFPSADTITAETSGSERLRITSAGLVGIGTDAPGSMLHLVSASSPTLRLQDTTNNCLTLLFSQNSNAHLGTFSAHPLIFDTNSISRIKINTATGSNNAEIKFSTNDSSTDYLKWGSNPRLLLKVPDGTNGMKISATTTPLEIKTSDENGRSFGFGSGGAANFDMNINGDYSLSANGYDSSPKLFFNATRHNGSSTVTSTSAE